jgi:hypothetical protein
MTASFSAQRGTNRRTARDRPKEEHLVRGGLARLLSLLIADARVSPNGLRSTQLRH